MCTTQHAGITNINPHFPLFFPLLGPQPGFPHPTVKRELKTGGEYLTNSETGKGAERASLASLPSLNVQKERD